MIPADRNETRGLATQADQLAAQLTQAADAEAQEAAVAAVWKLARRAQRLTPAPKPWRALIPKIWLPSIYADLEIIETTDTDGPENDMPDIDRKIGAARSVTYVVGGAALPEHEAQGHTVLTARLDTAEHLRADDQERLLSDVSTFIHHCFTLAATANSTSS